MNRRVPTPLTERPGRLARLLKGPILMVVILMEMSTGILFRMRCGLPVSVTPVSPRRVRAGLPSPWTAKAGLPGIRHFSLSFS